MPDIRHLPLAALPLVVVDVETTGLNPRQGDRVVEVALLRSQPGSDTQSFESLVHPARLVSAGAFAVNGISNEMLQGAPAFGEIAAGLATLLDGAVLVAHNAPFDLDFLTAEFARSGHSLSPPAIIDTCAIARNRYHFRSNRLEDVARHLGIDTSRGHRAMRDVWTTWQVLVHFMEDLSPQGIITVGHWQALQGPVRRRW
ncbi:MAG: 3'-5' exonuclease [Chloroflexi bacterium]|nr:3'-5' exonuclease [Chloroflexota bacterium]